MRILLRAALAATPLLCPVLTPAAAPTEVAQQDFSDEKDLYAYGPAPGWPPLVKALDVAPPPPLTVGCGPGAGAAVGGGVGGGAQPAASQNETNGGC